MNNSLTAPPLTYIHDTRRYESPPSVETRRVNLMGQERWVTIPTCDQSRPTRLTSIINANLEASIPGFPEPTTHNQNQNFIMFVGDSSSGDSVRFGLAVGRRLGVSICGSRAT